MFRRHGIIAFIAELAVLCRYVSNRVMTTLEELSALRNLQYR